MPWIASIVAKTDIVGGWALAQVFPIWSKQAGEWLHVPELWLAKPAGHGGNGGTGNGQGL